MTDRELQLTKKMWSQGYSARQIAKMLPYKEYIALLDIRELSRNGTLPERNVRQIKTVAVINEFEKTKNLQEIADKFGYSLGYVRNILWGNGIKHPKSMNFYKNEPNEKAQHIAKDLRLGKSQSKIAKDYSVSRQYVHQIKEKINEGLI